MPTDQLLVAARPVMKIEDAPNHALTDSLEIMRVHEGRDMPATLELEIGNWGVREGGGGPGFLHFDRATLDFGKRIHVAVGVTTLFDGRITALEGVYPNGGAPRLVLFAEDELQVLRLTRRTRIFEDASDADIVRAVAADHRLEPEVDLPGSQHACVAQLDQSDLAFLRDRVRAVGGELWVRDGVLHAARRADRAGAGTPPRLALGRELSELRVRADLAHQATEVVVAGWDVAAAARIAEPAGDAVLGAESGGGETGAQVLERAFGARVQTVAAATPATTAEASERAAALFRARARRFVRGEGVCRAPVGLQVGRAVTLEGLGTPFSGDYQLVDVVHRYDHAYGLRSELTVERAVLRTVDA